MERSRSVGSMTRSRWAAVGAAVAVTLGGGGLIGVSAAGPGDAAALVTVDPVRILDTRGSDKVDDETYVLQVTGSVTTYANGSTATATVVPAGASSVSMNLTVTEGVRNGGYGFVTAFPCTDAADTVPNASTINFVEGTDVANGVTVPLGADGEICLNVYGEAHLIVDVSGYYSDSRLDDLERDVALKADASEVFPRGPIAMGYGHSMWVASSLNTSVGGVVPFARATRLDGDQDGEDYFIALVGPMAADTLEYSPYQAEVCIGAIAGDVDFSLMTTSDVADAFVGSTTTIDSVPAGDGCQLLEFSADDFSALDERPNGFTLVLEVTGTSVTVESVSATWFDGSNAPN